MPTHRRTAWLSGIAALTLAGLAGAWYYFATEGGTKRIDVAQQIQSVSRYLGIARRGPDEVNLGQAEVPKCPPPPGLVEVTSEQARRMRLETTKVVSQVQPIRLELTGRTAYDPNTLNRVRPRFDTLVETVHVELGQVIHKGDPLLDLNSVDLAAAKNDIQAKYVQWQRDLRVLQLHQKLVQSGAVSQQTHIDSQNAENKSRLDYATARDKLRILGVPDADIDPLVQNLGDSPSISTSPSSIANKAKMTVYSRVDGVVIQREVVNGNFYDENDVLMVIAPIDHLWVIANVYEADQDKVAVGQELEVFFPFIQEKTHGVVEYVSSEVSRETRAVQIRASIHNLGGKLKADMLVSVVLQVPPVEGQTVVPRMAVVVLDGNEYVFTRSDQQHTENSTLFERRKISIAKENRDSVIVASGLEAGETVATSGSLLLAQLYEDLATVATGQPLQ